MKPFPKLGVFPGAAWPRYFGNGRSLEPAGLFLELAELSNRARRALFNFTERQNSPAENLLEGRRCQQLLINSAFMEEFKDINHLEYYRLSSPELYTCCFPGGVQVSQFGFHRVRPPAPARRLSSSEGLLQLHRQLLLSEHVADSDRQPGVTRLVLPGAAPGGSLLVIS